MDAMLRRRRSEAQQLTRGKAPTGIRYPAAFRTTAVALARPRLATGVPFVRGARELGLSTKSLPGGSGAAQPRGCGPWRSSPTRRRRLRPGLLAQDGDDVGHSCSRGFH